MEIEQDNTEHLKHLRSAHQRRLRELEVQAAKRGSSCPPDIIVEIEEIKSKISEIGKELGLQDSTIQSTHSEEGIDPGVSAYNDALICIRKAKELETKITHHAIARIAQIKRYRDDAKGLLRNAISKGYVHSEVFYELGELYTHEDSEESDFEAFEWFTMSIKLKEDHIGALKGRISVCRKLLGINNEHQNIVITSTRRGHKVTKKYICMRLVEHIYEHDQSRLDTILA